MTEQHRTGIDGEIDWFESLREAIVEDSEDSRESAIAVIDGMLNILRQRRGGIAGEPRCLGVGTDVERR
jgi:hypothetical protein